LINAHHKVRYMSHIATISSINDHLCGIFPSQIRQMPINIRFSEKKFQNAWRKRG